jgi:hypothetical protein
MHQNSDKKESHIFSPLSFSMSTTSPAKGRPASEEEWLEQDDTVVSGRSRRSTFDRISDAVMAMVRSSIGGDDDGSVDNGSDVEEVLDENDDINTV